MEEEGDGILWNAQEYSQLNPQITYFDGSYAWNVPAGYWRVKYEKEGYTTVWSDWMEVPPPQTGVNIAMVSELAPSIDTVLAGTTECRISFSMPIDSSGIFDIVLKDAEGMEIPYTIDGFENSSASDYSRTFDLVYDRCIEVTGKIQIVIPNGKESYREVRKVKEEKSNHYSKESIHGFKRKWKGDL